MPFKRIECQRLSLIHHYYHYYVYCNKESTLVISLLTMESNNKWQNLHDLIELAGDDEDDAIDFPSMLAVIDFFYSSARERAIKWTNIRLNWQEHVRRELHTRTFDTKYHMTLSSFNQLVDTLRPSITLDFVKSMNSTMGNTPIYPELIVGMGLRYLGGEAVKSIEDIFGVDHRSIPRLIDIFFDAVMINKELAIRLPSSIDQLQQLSNQFDEISTADHLFNGCVGAIDGYLCFTIQPIDPDIQNKRDYYSGHYQTFGLNIQAICDDKLHFLYFAVAAPGMTNDARAILKCVKLSRWIKSLEHTPYFLIGDNAYVLSDQLLIPFSGSNMTENQRTYNYFLSQLRIRIEMAFGRLTTKWRILRRKLENGTRRNSRICQVCAILHNYVINKENIDERTEDFIVAHPSSGEELGYTPTSNVDDLHETMNTTEGTSLRRTALVRIIGRDGMTRPQHNIDRNG